MARHALRAYIMPLSVAALWLATLHVQAVPVRVILDTDLAGDCDDVGAVAMLHALARRGEAEILAMGVSDTFSYAVLALDAINTWFGRPGVPIGALKGPGPGGSSRYARQLAQEYPRSHPWENDEDAPDVIDIYRAALAAAPDIDAENAGVVMISIGFMINFRNLLQSGPDHHSTLTGTQLVQNKVRLWVCMGGRFPSGSEYNVDRDAEAAQYAFDNWPTPIIFSGFEIGVRISTGWGLSVLPSSDIVRRAYELWGALAGRPSWDQAAILYAVRALGGGSAAHYWSLSGSGRIVVDSNGANTWGGDPAGAQHYKIERHPPELIAAEIEALMLERPFYTIRTFHGQDGSVIPEGLTMAPDLSELHIVPGASTSLTYRAAPFHAIARLTTDGVDIGAAAGQQEYIWHSGPATADVVNVVTFSESFWDGDGKTPLWWADLVGSADGAGLSVYQSYLLNREHLDYPFRITIIETNTQRYPILRWPSSGPARGAVTVMARTNLAHGAWQPEPGAVAHAGGTNTWSATQRVETNAFYRVHLAPEGNAGWERITDGLIADFPLTEGAGQRACDRGGYGVPLVMALCESAEWLVGRNGVWLTDSARLQSAGAADKLRDRIAHTGAFSLETWTKSGSPQQTGPARIVSYSVNSSLRNFTLGMGQWQQANNDMAFRLRTTGTTDNGEPQVDLTGAVGMETEHYVATYDGAMVRIYLNGELLAAEARGGTLDNWDAGHALVFGAEAGGDRGWTGELYSVSIYDRALTADEVQTNYVAGALRKAP